MSKRMLIDAAHTEETRVAIVDSNNTLLEYDFKSTFKQTIKGNIYLAKVARVEPSLQAAFIDYGGNRHGFLAFSEIHPDYFRIPVSDRERIEAELKGLTTPEGLDVDTDDSSSSLSSEGTEEGQEDDPSYRMPISTVGGDLPLNEDDDGENYFRKLSLHRRYKIQEVIHRNQILLVQVIKEERGGKGAALTTYLSLPGRYCVLMPNSPRSGGISRKISNPEDRKRLRKVLDALEIPEGMGLIIRTAGKERTKAELKRDAEYLMRLWNTIRETTLGSIAPAVIYEEDDIIKRAIRDLYSKDIEKIMVEGEEGYKVARNFMKTLMPSHTKRIQLYKNDISPLFHQYGVERQIDRMHEAQVFLPSGGSIVIHPTEALVSIDINSGRATRERHIEETAVKTNLEAAVEIARQIRLRDLAGLIVIDFIDMDEPRNVAAVERKVKEVFRNDRARVQVGKISPFGLLELSRQRLCPSILETSAYPCPHCNATGYIRSTESKALQILRVIEEEGMTRTASEVNVTLPAVIASYIFNKKRQHLSELEQRHGLTVQFDFNDHLEKPGFKISSVKRVNGVEVKPSDEKQKSELVTEGKPMTDTDGTSTKQRGTPPAVERMDQHPQQREGNKQRRNNRRRNQQNKADKAIETKLETSGQNFINAEMRPDKAAPTSDNPIIDVTPRFNPMQDESSEHNPPQPDTAGNAAEKRRRNRRRNNRRHMRQPRKKSEGESEASPAGHTMEHIEHKVVSLPPQNQNKSTLTSENKTAESENRTQTAGNKKKAKGWWQRLLE